MTGEAILTTTESKDLHLAKEQALLHMLKDDTMIYRDYTMDKGLIRSSREWDTIGRCLRSAYVTVTGIRDAGRSSCQVADERSSLLTMHFSSIADAGISYLSSQKTGRFHLACSERMAERSQLAHSVAALPQRGMLIDFAVEQMDLDQDALGIYPEMFLIHLAKSDLIREYFLDTKPQDYEVHYDDIQDKERFILKAVVFNILATYIATELIDSQGLDRRSCDFYRHVIAGSSEFRNLFLEKADYLHPKEGLLPDRRLFMKEQFLRSVAKSASAGRLKGSTMKARALRYIGDVAKSPDSL